MATSDGFVPITAVFYSVFHPTEGTKVVHQVPSGSIVPPSNDDNRLNNNMPDSSSFDQPLFDFDTIKNYVIPKPSLCNKLITLKVDEYRVLGFPVNIYGPQYARNSFGFNFCFVFPYESDTTPYEGNIKRIGRMFRALEEQGQLFSKSLKDSHVYFQDVIDPIPKIPTKFNMNNNKYYKVINDWDNTNIQLAVKKDAPGLNTETQNIISSIESLMQQIFQDLNNYSECKISIDASNAVDLKLFPISPPPPYVHSYEVPIALLKLGSLIDSLWDPTMLKVCPFIDGVNSVAKISSLSYVNLELTKECIRHFIHYKCVTIVDIFQFSNHYMVTSTIGNFLRDPLMAINCQDYVLSPHGSFQKTKAESLLTRSDSHSNSVNSKTNDFPLSASFSSPAQRKPGLSGFAQYDNQHNRQQVKKVPLPSKATLFQLYNSLNSNKSVEQWYTENRKLLEYIDVRKLITFGVSNGLIARIHEYPVIGKAEKNIVDETSGNLLSVSEPHTFDPESSKMIKVSNLNVSSLPLLNETMLKNTKKNNRKLLYDKGPSIIRQFDDIDSSSSDDSSISESDAASSGSENEQDDQFHDAHEVRLKEVQRLQKEKITRILKHTPHMDSICTSMRLSRTEVYSILEGIGDVEIIER
ncbi:hypothetical protein CANINC_002171 [Pichia inconspicua]|uniref:Nitrogen permease regulator 2 n=1 Tax=Pichia inconspicua TaxID=52247 RepID=A0A4V4NFS9_9ASCO|nr:hypothetical protein CANINC_002171 [[Candida] inconspicua]